MSRYVRILRYITLARVSLIRARVARQKATILSECATNTFSWVQDAFRISRLRAEAKYHRRNARLALQEAERLNGQIFMDGHIHRVVALKYGLDGKRFADWAEHGAEYAHDTLFKGQDPEL